jgi:general secretion pathway protein B
MSYILDALKKAESERHLGTIPNLHTEQPAVIVPLVRTRPSNAAPWPWIALAALSAALAALAWFRPWQPAPGAAAPPVTAALPAQPAPVSANTPPAPPAPTTSSSAPPSSATPPVTAAPEKEAKEKAVKKTSPSAKPPVEKKLAEKKPTPAALPRQKKMEPQPKQDQEPANEQRTVALHELPAAIQSEIPALRITGYIYSANKADRTVLINKKLLREGDRIAPDFTLEKLTPTGMVLNYKGYRYRTGY